MSSSASSSLPEILTPPSSPVDPRVHAEAVFAWLIAPTTVEEFMEKHWEKEPLLVKRDNVGYVDGLFDIHDFHRVVITGETKGVLDLGDTWPGKPTPLEFSSDLDITQYVDDKRHTLNGEGEVDGEEAWKAMEEEGCSLRLACPQSRSHTVYALCARLEDFFRTFVGANVYLTPPDTQGFAPHYDDIEAFIVQTGGKKHWKVYAPRDDSEVLPRYSSRNFTEAEVGECVLECLLEPGDLLYLPRGWIHQARGVGDEPSCHVTISAALHTTYFDFARTALEGALASAAAEEVFLRTTLPPHASDVLGVRNEDVEDDPRREELHDTLHKLLQLVMERVTIDPSMDQMTRQFVRTRLPPILPTPPPPPSPITPASHVTLRHPTAWAMCIEGGSLVIYSSLQNSLRYLGAPEHSITFPLTFAPTFEALAEIYPAPIQIAHLPTLEGEEEEEEEGRGEGSSSSSSSSSSGGGEGGEGGGSMKLEEFIMALYEEGLVLVTE